MFVVPKTTCAADVMQTRLTTIGPKTHFSEAVTQMVRHEVSGLPVVDADETYLGMFSEKCCLRVLNDCPLLHAATGNSQLIAGEAMTSKLVLLREDDDVFSAMEQLLRNHVSGAPVLDSLDQFVGIFSEKTSVSVLIQSVFDGLQSAHVGRFTDRDPGRIVSETTPLSEIVQTFVETEFRRLPVLKNRCVVGQISRRDVINHPHIYRWISGLRTGVTARSSTKTSYSVLSFADTTARTIDPDLDLLSILGIFLNTPYRRLPVLDNGRLIGQISRRDVIQKVMDETKQVPASRHGTSLYLSAINSEPPKLQ